MDKFPLEKHGASLKGNPNLVAQKFSKIKYPETLELMAASISVHPSLLINIQPYKYDNILYPRAAICIYELLKQKTIVLEAENKCNNLISTFLEQKIQDIGANEYLKIYRSAATDKIREIVMLRILAATFCFGKSKLDYLPETHRKSACQLLNLNQEVTQKQAIELLEEKTNKATSEEQILGRLGYLITWKELAGSDFQPNINEEDDKIEIIKNAPKDNRGIPIDRSILGDWDLDDKDDEIVITDDDGNIIGPESKPQPDPSIKPIVENARKTPQLQSSTIKQFPPISNAKSDIENALEWRGFSHDFIRKSWVGPKNTTILDSEIYAIVDKYGSSLQSVSVAQFFKDLDTRVANAGWNSKT